MATPEPHERLTSPWFYAVVESLRPRTSFSRASYITPEDIGAAADAGADPVELATEVLDAIGRGVAEDVRACAFVAHEAISSRPKAG